MKFVTYNACKAIASYIVYSNSDYRIDKPSKVVSNLALYFLDFANYFRDMGSKNFPTWNDTFFS